MACLTVGKPLIQKNKQVVASCIYNDGRVRITTGVMVEATGNVASHTAKAASEEGLAQAFMYEADEK